MSSEMLTLSTKYIMQHKTREEDIIEILAKNLKGILICLQIAVKTQIGQKNKLIASMTSLVPLVR